MKKKLLISFLSVLMVVACAIGFAACGSDVKNYNTYPNGLIFTLSDNETSYAVAGIGSCTDSNISIPAEYNGLPVSSINDSAFSNCKFLTNVTIPDTVTSIGGYAFSWCTSLTSITIPNSVTNIGFNAFGDCDSLESITLPFVGATKDGTENTHFGFIFGSNEYDYNISYVPESLKTVVITGGLSIDDNAFYNCALTSVTIEDGVTSIGESAFSSCGSLTSVTIPNSMTSIGEYAFSWCSSLTLSLIHISEPTRH